MTPRPTAARPRTALAAALLATLLAGSLVAVAPAQATTGTPIGVPPGAAPCTGGSLLGAREVAPFGAVGNGEGNVIDYWFNQLKDAAAAEVASAGVGWVIDTIFGHQTDPDVAKLQEQVAALNARFDEVEAQIASLKAQVDATYNAQFTESERVDYDAVAHNYTLDKAKLNDALTHFEAWSNRPVGSAVDAGMSDLLLGMRRDLGTMLEHIHEGMIGGGSARGMIEIYRSVVFRTLPNFDPTLTKVGDLYTSELTTPVFDQLSYWKGIAVQIFTLLSEVYHLSWTIGVSEYKADTDYVACTAAKLLGHFAQWEQVADHGYGRLSDNVVVDHRNNLIWTRVPITPPQTGVPEPMAGRACWVADCLPGLTQPALPGWLSTATIGGFANGWRIPSKADFLKLVAGHEAKPLTYLRQNLVRWPGTDSWSDGKWYPEMDTIFLSDPFEGGQMTVSASEHPLSVGRVFTYQGSQFCYGPCIDMPNWAIAVRPTSLGLGGLPPGDEDGETEGVDDTNDPPSTTAAPSPGATPTVNPRFTG